MDPELLIDALEHVAYGLRGEEGLVGDLATGLSGRAAGAATPRAASRSASETTSTLPSTTRIAVWSSITYPGSRCRPPSARGAELEVPSTTRPHVHGKRGSRIGEGAAAPGDVDGVPGAVVRRSTPPPNEPSTTTSRVIARSDRQDASALVDPDPRSRRALERDPGGGGPSGLPPRHPVGGEHEPGRRHPGQVRGGAAERERDRRHEEPGHDPQASADLRMTRGSRSPPIPVPASVPPQERASDLDHDAVDRETVRATGARRVTAEQHGACRGSA